MARKCLGKSYEHNPLSGICKSCPELIECRRLVYMEKIKEMV
jgi:hypothetical protein